MTAISMQKTEPTSPLKINWEFCKISYPFLRQNLDLLLYIPFIIFIVLLVLAGCLSLAGHFGNSLQKLLFNNALITITIFGIFTYLTLVFTVIFFNTAFVSCIITRLRGQSCSLFKGTAIAARSILQLLNWSLISSTFGLLLTLVSNLNIKLGQWLASKLGFSWPIVHYFAPAIIAIQHTNVRTAFKTATLEVYSQAKAIINIWSSLALINLSIIFGALLIKIFTATHHTHLLATISGSLILCGTLIGIIINAIQRSALYLYLIEKTQPKYFDQTLLKQALTPK